MKLAFNKLAFLPGALSLCVMLLAVRAVANDPALIRIGYQKYGTLNIVRAHGELDKALDQHGKKVQWFLFSWKQTLNFRTSAGRRLSSWTGFDRV
jgi:hypothetical protein